MRTYRLLMWLAGIILLPLTSMQALASTPTLAAQACSGASCAPAGGELLVLVSRFSEAELYRYRNLCRRILSDPNGYDPQLVKLCTLVHLRGGWLGR